MIFIHHLIKRKKVEDSIQQQHHQNCVKLIIKLKLFMEMTNNINLQVVVLKEIIKVKIKLSKIVINILSQYNLI
jgi:hypothetical protein